MFSKFDFSASSEAEQKKKKKKTLTPEQQLAKVEAEAERLAALRKEDAAKAAEIEERIKWKKALDRSKGEKVKDDKALLKKTIKRKERQKLRSELQWFATFRRSTINLPCVAHPSHARLPVYCPLPLPLAGRSARRRSRTTSKRSRLVTGWDVTLPITAFATLICSFVPDQPPGKEDKEPHGARKGQEGAAHGQEAQVGREKGARRGEHHFVLFEHSLTSLPGAMPLPLSSTPPPPSLRPHSEETPWILVSVCFANPIKYTCRVLLDKKFADG